MGYSRSTKDVGFAPSRGTITAGDGGCKRIRLRMLTAGSKAMALRCHTGTHVAIEFNKRIVA